MEFRRREEIRVDQVKGLGAKARRSTGSLLYVLVVLACVVLALALSTKYRMEWDFSASSDNTLSPQTLDLLSSIDADVRLTALFTSREPRREDYWNLLERYRRASPRVRVEFVDPVARPGVVKELGVNPAEETGRRREGVTLVSRGDRRLLFRGVTEEDVTNAIMEVGSNRRRVMGFVRGHGERDPSSTGPDGLKSLADALRQEYYETRDVTLDRDVPPDTTVLVIAGFTQPVGPDELDRLARWLDGGGRLLVLSDLGTESGIENLLERWGLRATGEIALDPRENVNGDPKFVKVTSYTTHPIVRAFGASFPTVFPNAQAVTHFEAGDPDLFRDDLAQTGRFSEAITLQGARRQGPLSVAAASWKRLRRNEADAETRIVLVGGSQFATNTFLPAASNRNFTLNCVGWLAREQALVSIRRPSIAGQGMDFSPKERRTILLAIAVPPLFIVVAGIAMAIRRSRL